MNREANDEASPERLPCPPAPLQGGVEEGVKDIIEGEDPDTWLDAPGEEEEGEEGACLPAAPAVACYDLLWMRWKRQ